MPAAIEVGCAGEHRREAIFLDSDDAAIAVLTNRKPALLIEREAVRAWLAILTDILASIAGLREINADVAFPCHSIDDVVVRVGEEEIAFAIRNPHRPFGERKPVREHTFIARRNGYTLGMNRDEKLTRAAGLPPRLTHLNGRAILAPSEPGGGTWIGVNDTGATLALINWYSVASRVGGQAVSRGEVVKLALPSDSSALVNAVLKELPLACMNPFRLIGVYPASKGVVEWRWNHRCLEHREHCWRTNTWISSGFDEPGAQQTRGKTFGEAMQQASAGSTDWLRRLHRSHGSESGPYSTCMHREDAATVSYSEVTVTRQMAKMRYAPGALCCTAPLPGVRLQLNT